MPLASKAREVTVLLSQLERRREALIRIQELYPDCRFHFDGRLSILCPSARVVDRVTSLPKALNFKAHNIIEVLPDGTYRRIKLTSRPLGEVIRSCLGLRQNTSESRVQSELQGIFGLDPQPESPTCWSRLLDDPGWNDSEDEE